MVEAQVTKRSLVSKFTKRAFTRNLYYYVSTTVVKAEPTSYNKMFKNIQLGAKKASVLKGSFRNRRKQEENVRVVFRRSRSKNTELSNTP